MITIICLITGLTAGAALFGGGGGVVDPWKELGDAWERGIHKVVDDDKTEASALMYVDQYRKTMDEMRLEQNAAMKRLFAADEKYDATLADYEPAIEELGNIGDRADSIILNQRYKVKELLTDKEFADLLADVQKKMAKVKKDVAGEVEDADKDSQKQLEDVNKTEAKAAEK